MSAPLREDTTIPPSTAAKFPSSPPPISIPFRFKPKRSLSPTAHDTRPHHYSSPADYPISPPTNTNTTIPSPPSAPSFRSKRKRSLSPAESPRPHHTPTSPPSTIKPIRFKRRRGASYRPNYPDVPFENDLPTHRSYSPPPINESFSENPSNRTSKAKPKPKKKTPRPPKKPPKRRRRHPRSRRPDDEDPPPHHHQGTQWDAQIDPDTAFRESLFDAMADDEGAAFWEGVYGQPIHTYSAYYAAAPTDADGDGDDPEKPRLEKMTEEEYVRYVRNKMYEKSHGYIFEERARREDGKRAAAARKKQERLRRKRWDGGVEEALRRGEERRRAGRWRKVWEGYLGAWNGAGEVVKEKEEEKEGYADRIRWPVQSGQRRDVGREEIKRFFEHAPQSGGGNVDLLEVLKKERVRWHPDKMQQRAGEGGLDNETTKLVTAVFQIIDRLWSEKKGGA